MAVGIMFAFWVTFTSLRRGWAVLVPRPRLAPQRRWCEVVGVLKRLQWACFALLVVFACLFYLPGVGVATCLGVLVVAVGWFLGWLLKGASLDTDTPWIVLVRKASRVSRTLGPGGWRVGFQLRRSRLVGLLEGEGFGRAYVVLYVASLVFVVCLAFGLFFDNASQVAIVSRSVVAFSVVLIASSWVVSWLVVVVVGVLVVGAFETIRFSLVEYVRSLASVVGISGLGGSFAGACVPILAIVVGSGGGSEPSLLGALSPSLFLDTASVGAVIGFVLGVPWALPRLLVTRNAIYGSVPAPLLFFLVTCSLVYLPDFRVSPEGLAEGLTRVALRGNVSPIAGRDLVSGVLPELFSDWPRMLVSSKESGFHLGVIGDKEFLWLTFLICLLSAVAELRRIYRQNQCSVGSQGRGLDAGE